MKNKVTEKTGSGFRALEKRAVITKRIETDKNLLPVSEKISGIHLPGRELSADDLTAISRSRAMIRTGGQINRPGGNYSRNLHNRLHPYSGKVRMFK